MVRLEQLRQQVLLDVEPYAPIPFVGDERAFLSSVHTLVANRGLEEPGTNRFQQRDLSIAIVIENVPIVQFATNCLVAGALGNSEPAWFHGEVLHL